MYPVHPGTKLMEPLRWRLVQHVHWESRISVEGLSLISLIGTFNRYILSDDILIISLHLSKN